MLPHYVSILIACCLKEEILTVVQARTCKRDEDCVNQGAERCAICVDDLTGSGSGCVYIQPQIYRPTASCARYDDENCPLQCGPGTCLTTDTNSTTYYAPYCYCEHETRASLKGSCAVTPVAKPALVAVRRLFDGPIIPCCGYYFFHFQILVLKHSAEDDLPADMSIYFKAGDLPFHQYPNEVIAMTPVSQLLFSAEEAIRFTFPYKRDDSNLRLNNIPLGYNTDVLMNLFSGGRLLYSYSWDVFVTYEHLTCTPSVGLSNCGKSAENSVTVVRRSEFEIKIAIECTPVDLCTVCDLMAWKVWKIVDGRTSNAPQYHGDTKTSSAYFAPFGLQSGAYLAEVEVSYFFPKQTVKNSNWCYFRIICEPLVAAIRGGSDIMVGAERLCLRADGSYDPNRRSDSQDHVNIEWSCTSETGNTGSVCDPKQLKVYETYCAPHDTLTPGAVYYFTLKVWTDLYDDTGECATSDVSPSFAHITIRVAAETLPARDYQEVVIECLQNCGPKMIHSRKLFLEASQGFNVIQYVDYEWTYHASGEPATSPDQIVEPGLTPSLLVIKENALNAGTNYTIGVKIKNSSWYAEYSFETYAIDYEAACIVDPHSGVKGSTLFNINCTVRSNLTQSSSFVFEYYDRGVDEKARGEHVFSGRMLGASLDGVLTNIRLTRGHVFIFIFNEHGLYLEKHVAVELSNWDVDRAALASLYKAVSDQLDVGAPSTALGLLSVVPDVIPAGMDGSKGDMLNTLLWFITRLPLNTVPDMKLTVSTLFNILFAMNKPSILSLEPDLMAAILKVVEQQGALYYQDIVSDQAESVDPDDVKQVFKTIMNIVEVLLACKDDSYADHDEEDIEPATARRLRDISEHAEETLSIASEALSFIQVSGQLATRVSSQNDLFVVWVIVTHNIDLIPHLVSRATDIPIVLGDKLCDDLKNRKYENEELAVIAFSSKENIFWWSESDIHSRLVSVTMNRRWDKTRTFPIRYVDNPMEIILKLDGKLNSTIVNGSVNQLDPDIDPLSLDLALKVYRVDIPRGSLVSMTFTVWRPNGSLRVYVEDRVRPDYSSMKEKAVMITETSPEYRVPYYGYEEPYFLFMGVMPGPEVRVNESVPYAFQIHTSLCQTWVKGGWSSVGCRVKSVDRGQLVCDCTHFSIFAAAFPVPPNAVDPFSDAKLFLTIVDNAFVVGVVAVILLLYLMLCLLCWRSDRQNKKKRHVIVLEDNLPTDAVPYLIAVYTSSRWNAGTSSHVGVRLIGDAATSRRHMLLSKHRKPLQTNSDDWFLLFCAQPLGRLQSIHVWHDHHGPSPEWFCDKICVFDLQKQKQLLFVVDEWLALRAEQFPEAIVLPTAVGEFTDFRSLFLSNVVLGFREKHMFLSCLASHPRDEVSRIQRISVFLCGVMIAMLCNIMFYLPEDERQYMDEYYYSIGAREFYVGIQTVVICLLVNFIIIMLFRRSYKNTYHKSKRRVSQSMVGSHKASLGKSVHKKFVKIMMNTIETYPMTPVTLPNSELALEVRQFWLILAWTTCILILTICPYLIMLYGLKLGLVASQEWLSSILIGMGEEILLFAPIKIVFMSIILAVAFKHMVELNVHKIPMKEVIEFNISDDPEYILKVIERRKHPMYKPMSSELRYETLRREEVREKWWTLADFIISIVLAVVLNQVIFQLWISHYHTNAHNVNLITRPSHDTFGSVKFFFVENIPSLEDYLEFTFVSSLYNLRWYNGEVLNVDNTDTGREYWARDCTHRMFGVPEVRQFRVVPKHCRNIVLKGGKCIPHWLARHEDTDDYGERWKPVLWSDASRPSSPWKYTEKNINLLFYRYKMYGPSGNVYHPGGYIETLDPTRKQTELKLAELRKNSWLDVRTRAVIVELTVCSANLNLLTHVTLMVEYMVTGTVMKLAAVDTVDTKMTFTIWYVLFIALTWYYLLRVFCLINRNGAAVFLSFFTNVCRVIIVFLGATSIALFFTHYYRSTGVYETFESHGLDRYFEFDSFVTYIMGLRHVLCLLLGASILHVIALLRVGRCVLDHVHTLRLSLWLLACVTAAMAVLILALVHSAPLAFLPSAAKTIITTKKSLGHLGKVDLECVSVRMFIVVKTVLVNTCLCMYVVTFVWHIRLAKAWRHTSSQTHFNYITFIIHQFVK